MFSVTCVDLDAPVITVLTSGFFTPISNMPMWLQHVTLLNPMRYFMMIVRSIMMKGAGLPDLLPQVLALAVFGTAIFIRQPSICSACIGPLKYKKNL